MKKQQSRRQEIQEELGLLGELEGELVDR